MFSQKFHTSCTTVCPSFKNREIITFFKRIQRFLTPVALTPLILHTVKLLHMTSELGVEWIVLAQEKRSGGPL
jgi:hypothetical protein